VPHIAVHTSADTDELTNEKGFERGLWQLLRPYGERIQGKVTIRDSIGASRICDDFAVRFVQLGDRLERATKPPAGRRSTEGPNITQKAAEPSPNFQSSGSRFSKTGGNVATIEKLVEKHLSYAETFRQGANEDYVSFKLLNSKDSDTLSPFYTLYLRRLLSGVPMAPHETFSHPVACIIAISSRNPNPIEALRRLYDESSSGEKRLPLWVNSDEYLRYYVLVHDEEKDDISKSMALFEQMKRHFGLHCHLLRLRSSHCILTDDDAITLPACDWLSASEELTGIQTREAQEDLEESPLCLYESDATAIRTFIREMVTQSVVPSMERLVSTWNDQVASRRRGFSGRFISLSKKWTGFGGSSRTSSGAGTSANASGSNSNYDTQQGFYRPETPEAIMLRDWKLAQSTYDLCRSDFNNDKAWKYHAAANEMAALSILLSPQTLTTKIRTETIDQLLETATYSYITRCSDSYGSSRCLALSIELLKVRGGSAIDDAARWGSKLLEAKVVGPIGDALVKERIAACYSSRKGSGSGRWGSRTRKSALWNILAADEWLSMRKYVQAENRMLQVEKLYENLTNTDSLSRFPEANAFLLDIKRELLHTSSLAEGRDSHELLQDETSSDMDEESEALDLRSHRKSLMGVGVSPLAGLETAPLQTTSERVESSINRDDDFV